MPGTMKAAAIDRFGPPSVITLHTLPTPEPGPREVLIALHAAGVGVWDAEIPAGWWPEGRAAQLSCQALRHGLGAAGRGTLGRVGEGDC